MMKLEGSFSPGITSTGILEHKLDKKPSNVFMGITLGEVSLFLLA